MRTNNLLTSTALTTSAMLASSGALAQSGDCLQLDGLVRRSQSWRRVDQDCRTTFSCRASSRPPRATRDAASSSDFRSAITGSSRRSGCWVSKATSIICAANWPTVLAPPSPLAAAARISSALQQTKLRWLSTIRGRFGYTWSRSFIYATGGLAIGSVDSTVTGSAQESDLDGDADAILRILFQSPDRMDRRWRMGASLHRQDLASSWSICTTTWAASATTQSAPLRRATAMVLPLTWPASARISGDIVRVGVNLKFAP